MDTPRSTRLKGSGPIGHVAAPHLARPEAPPPPQGFAEPVRGLGPLEPLDEVLRGLSWATPRTRELAREAVEKLKRTRAQLDAVAADPSVAELDLLGGVEQLGVRCDWVLKHWTGELDRLTEGGWSSDHEQGLISDLRLLAAAGAPLRNRIRQLAANPESASELVAASDTAFVGDGSGARHRRSASSVRGVADAEQGPESAVAALARMMHRHRLIGFSLAAGTAALAIGALFRVVVLHPAAAPRSAAPADSGRARATQTAREPSSAPAGHGASTPDASVSNSPAAGVTDLKVLLLGGSATEQQVVADIVLETASTAPVRLEVSYWGQDGAVRHRQSWYSTTLSGALNYEVPLGIPAELYCGQVVEVSVSAGERSKTTSTSPGC